LSWEIVVNPASDSRSPWDRSALQSLVLGALILQAAESCGAAVLYSEDLASGQRYGAVEVVNPLRA